MNIQRSSTLRLFLVALSIGLALVHSLLAVPPSATGQKVLTNATVNVRATANGTILGTQPSGRQGTVIGGPTTTGGYTWWNINFDNSTLDGWVASIGIDVLPPNLVPSNYTISPNSGPAGTSFNISFRINNTGGSTAIAFNTNVRLSTSSSSPSTSDPLLITFSTSSLAVGSIANANADVSIPVGTSSGTKYIWVIVDVNNTSGQTSAQYGDDRTYLSFAVTVPPAAPGYLETQSFSNRVELGWDDNSTNETGFKIERRTGSGSYAEIATTGANSGNAAYYTDYTTTSRTTYTYRVRAYNSAGNSSYSTEASATPPGGPPGSFTLSYNPAIWDTSIPGPKVQLNWSSSTDVGGYALYRNGSLYVAGIAGTSYLNSANLTGGATYTYFIRASNADGTTDSNTVTVTMPSAPVTIPSAPGYMEAQAFSDRVELGWTDNSTNESGFKIERRTGSGSYSQIATTGANSGNSAYYTDNTTSPQTTYTYRVRAYNSAGNSGYNNEVTATTPGGPPGAFILSSDPAIWDASIPGPSVQLQWSTSADVGGYAVYRNGQVYVAGLAGTMFRNKAGLSAGSTYTYFVRASNADGATDSNTITVTMPNSPPQLSGPSPKQVLIGATATFSVSVAGIGPFNYQWRKDGQNISGATAATYTIPNAQVSNGGSYQVIVTNSYGTAASTAVALTVFTTPPEQEPTPPTPAAASQTPAQVLTTKPTNTGQMRVFTGAGGTTGDGTIDRLKKTIVMTHGWRSNGKQGDSWPVQMKTALLDLRTSYRNDVNVISWDWSSEADTPLSFALGRTQAQGEALGRELLIVLGSDYNLPIHFMGHSLGTLVNCSAADFIHGDNPRSPVSHLRPENTHLSLFDEAELAVVSIIAEDIADFDVDPLLYLEWLANQATRGTGARLGKVIPDQFAWIDNYVSGVGLLHPGTVNATLWRSDTLNPQTAHGYSYEWYRGTVIPYNISALGSRWSFERGTLPSGSGPLSAPSPPLFYRQSTAANASVYDLDRVSAIEAYLTSGGVPLLSFPRARIEQAKNRIQAAATKAAIAAVEKTGDLIVSVSQFVSLAGPTGTPVYSGVAGSTPAYYVPVGTSGPSSGQAEWDTQFLFLKDGGTGGSNLKKGPTPMIVTDSAYAWLTVPVPEDAVGLSFEFRITGAAPEDFVTVGINDVNVFSLEAKYVTDATWTTAPPANVTAVAGKTVQIFYGFNSSGVAGGQMEVRNITFYRMPPKLEIVQTDDAGVELCWSPSGQNLKLQETDNLNDLESWQDVTIAPTFDGFEYSVTWPIVSQRHFFRLIALPRSPAAP